MDIAKTRISMMLTQPSSQKLVKIWSLYWNKIPIINGNAILIKGTSWIELGSLTIKQ
jgi:hypothetical protein